MGSIDPYSTSAGRRYRVRYRRPDGSQTDKRGFRTKREAELYLASVEVRKATGTFLDPAHSRVRVDELGPPWLEVKRAVLKPSAYRSVEAAWRLRVQPRWGRTTIADITHSDVKRWIATMTNKWGPSVVLNAHAALAGILDDAVHDRRLASNPARGGRLGLPKKIASRHVYLSHRQVDDMANASGRYGTLVRTLSYTGLRWAEVVALQVENIDFVRGRVWVLRNAVEVGSEILVGTPKSHKIRDVPLPQFLRHELLEHIAGREPKELVFPGRDGFMRRPRVSRGSRSWVKNAMSSIGVTDLTLHDLRHTAASLAVQAGANVKAVQRMLGHASASMTLDVYADLFDDDLDAVSEALDRARAASLNQQLASPE